jgi:hypothetical protein
MAAFSSHLSITPEALVSKIAQANKEWLEILNSNESFFKKIRKQQKLIKFLENIQ